MIYIGIDPGAHGGMVALYGSLVETKQINENLEETWQWLKDQADASLNVFGQVEALAIIEEVGGYVGGGPKCPLCGQERNRSPGSSMFNFGSVYGTLLMALTAANLPFKRVKPQSWQKGLSIPPRDRKGGETDTAWKNRLKNMAQKLFPKVKVTLDLSDALLIAYYARTVKS